MAVAVLDGRSSPFGLSSRWLVVGGVLLAGLLLLSGLALRPTPVAEPPLLAEIPFVDPTVQARWLAAGSVPAVPELVDSTLVSDALRDLHTLSQPYGVPVAGWAEPWQYVWPRDSALAAAALARTGHPADADRVLDFLQRVQPASGEFHARYRPDGSGVPDDRGIQLDGTGWALWATAEVVKARPAGERTALVQRYRGLLDRSTARALAATDHGRTLPRSADYWETWEWRPTLATAALLHGGLVAAADLYAVAGETAAERLASAGAAKLWSTIQDRFGSAGYPRRVGGRASTIDLGVNFLLPPFAPATDPAAQRAWQGAAPHLARPAGGLAPGGSWRDDGLSWTTSTSIYALTAAATGDRAAALGWLRWLDAHRTATGALPEKVTATGRPAAVAPLAWTAAVVVLAASELERN